MAEVHFIDRRLAKTKRKTQERNEFGRRPVRNAQIVRNNDVLPSPSDTFLSASSEKLNGQHKAVNQLQDTRIERSKHSLKKEIIELNFSKTT
jgi:hypothetical protein